MARETSTNRGRRSGIALEGTTGPGERRRMVAEAAYYRYVRRGFVHGHDLDDWLAAEADLDSGGLDQQPSASGEIAEFEVQQSGSHSFRQDAALKRIVRQHPLKGIQQVEGIEPQEAPPKQ